MCDTLQKKYYFFGAGNNCHGAVNFFGAERIIAIVDNSKAKIGNSLLGIPIISFESLKKEWKGEIIIITAYIFSDEIVQQLEKEGIDKYYCCPSMQSGFYSCSEIIERLALKTYRSIDVYDNNPISEKLMNGLLKNEKRDIRCVSEDDLGSLQEDRELMLIAKNELNIDLSKINQRYAKVLYLFDEIRKMQKEDTKNLEKFKNVYKGEKCFLIGNGPSLKEGDLDKINKYKIKSLACNKIYKIFDKTIWRPDYCVIIDSLVWEEERGRLLKECRYFMRKWQDGELYTKDFDIQFYCAKTEKYYPQYPTFSNDITNCVYGGRTVMYDMMQIAVYMGFKEIYLLGVDFSWGEDGKNTHFCKDYYDTTMLTDETVNDTMRYKDEIRHAYISARDYADAHGIKIYNATRGGNLDVFERVDIDKLFGEFEKNEMQSVQ